MPYWSSADLIPSQGDFTTPGTSADVKLVLELDIASTSIPLNRHEVAWLLKMVETTNANPRRENHDCTATVSVNGLVYNATNLDYNFDGTNETIVVASGSTLVTQNPDGNKIISVSADYNGRTPLGTASVSAIVALPTIPRNRAYVGVDDEWVEAETYVGVNGVWVPALISVGVDGQWKQVGA